MHQVLLRTVEEAGVAGALSQGRRLDGNEVIGVKACAWEGKEAPGSAIM